MFFFFFKDPPTTEIYSLSLPVALPISAVGSPRRAVPPDEVLVRLVAALGHVGQPGAARRLADCIPDRLARMEAMGRSEEHTSELQSRQYIVCRLLLDKKTQST